MALTDKIIEMSIALIIFAGLAGGVFTGVESLVATTSDPTTKVALGLVGILFALGVALAVYYEMVKHKKS
jgi:hypothetical protein